MDHKVWIFLTVLSHCIWDAQGADTICYAINLGGDTVVGSDGLTYKADMGLHRKFTFRRVSGVPDEDRLIYRTAFWDTKLKMILPYSGEGFYTLILKAEADRDDKPMKVSLDDYGVLWNFKVTDLVWFYVGKDIMATFRVQNGTVHHIEKNADFARKGETPFLLEVKGNENNRVLLSAIVWKYSPFWKYSRLTTTKPPTTSTATTSTATTSTATTSTSTTMTATPTPRVGLDEPIISKPCDESAKIKEYEAVAKKFKKYEAKYLQAFQALAVEFDGVKKAFELQYKTKTNASTKDEKKVSIAFDDFSETLSEVLEYVDAMKNGNLK
jgi:hypothetical protein